MSETNDKSLENDDLVAHLLGAKKKHDEDKNVESEEVEPKKDVSDDDIWNIDSIVKKNRKKKPQKGVIRFAEDIEDLRK